MYLYLYLYLSSLCICSYILYYTTSHNFGISDYIQPTSNNYYDIWKQLFVKEKITCQTITLQTLTHFEKLVVIHNFLKFSDLLIIDKS